MRQRMGLKGMALMKKRDRITQEAIDWYRKERAIYLELCDEVTALMKERLQRKGIMYNDISYRAKEIESYRDKCYKRKYSNPMNEIYDMAGIRITTYTTAEVKKIKKIIEENFEIDQEHCSDKSETIEVDRFGYLSVHYIAEFPHYSSDPHIEKFEGMKFEIQVRTLLQHAWSEVEHDRNYKFNGVLPKELKRRFYRLAGILELVDDEFESLAHDVEVYKRSLASIGGEEAMDVVLDRETITSYFSRIYDDDMIFDNSNSEVIQYLNTFGIYTLADLDTLYESVSEEVISHMLDLNGPTYNAAQLARDIMVVNDVTAYYQQWDYLWPLNEEDISYFELFDVDIRPYV